MNRYTTSTLALSTMLTFALQADTPSLQGQWTSGIAVIHQNMPYKEMDDRTQILPIIRYEDAQLYWHKSDTARQLPGDTGRCGKSRG